MCTVNAGGSWGNGAQVVRMRTRNGLRLFIGDSRVCSTPQAWTSVPSGYTLAGLVTQQPESAFGTAWVHRIAFVFAGM